MAKIILIDRPEFDCFSDLGCFTNFSKQMKSTDKWAYVARIDSPKQMQTTKYFVNVYGEWKSERGDSHKIYNPTKKFEVTNGSSRKHYGKYVYSTVGAIHRLVAKAFLPNPDNCKEVDHIDGNPSNNNIGNLRWVSHKQNMDNPIRKKRFKKNWTMGYIQKSTIGVIQYSLDFSKKIAVFKTEAEAAKALNLSRSGVVKLCNQQAKHNSSQCADYWLRKETIYWYELSKIKSSD